MAAQPASLRARVVACASEPPTKAPPIAPASLLPAALSTLLQVLEFASTLAQPLRVLSCQKAR
jgi:hypothetical protein